MKNKLAQVWIETVIYTLIAFVLIGAVLAFAKPKIDELKDKSIVEQSINMLKDLDNSILSMGIPGNQRVVTLGISKGSLKIDGENDKLIFEMDGKYTYGEPGKEITEGNVIILTEKSGKNNHITMTNDYSRKYNITFNDKDEVKTITASPTSYQIVIFKGAQDANNMSVIDFGLA